MLIYQKESQLIKAMILSSSINQALTRENRLLAISHHTSKSISRALNLNNQAEEITLIELGMIGVLLTFILPLLCHLDLVIILIKSNSTHTRKL